MAAGRHDGLVVTMPAAGDLTGAATGSALTVNSSGRVALTSAADQTIVGYLVTPAPSSKVGAGVDVLVRGWVDAIAQSAITAGQYIISTTSAGRVDGSGTPANIAASLRVGGIAMTAATAAGDTVRVAV